MNTTSMFGIMDLIVIGGGIYVLYQYVIMVTSRHLKPNVLFPKELNLKKCKDVEGFIHYVGLKQLIFGIVALVCGIIGLIQDYTQSFGAAWYMGAIVVFLVVAVWYSMAIKTAIKLYWGK